MSRSINYESNPAKQCHDTQCMSRGVLVTNAVILLRVLKEQLLDIFSKHITGSFFLGILINFRASTCAIRDQNRNSRVSFLSLIFVFFWQENVIFCIKIPDDFK